MVVAFSLFAEVTCRPRTLHSAPFILSLDLILILIVFERGKLRLLLVSQLFAIVFFDNAYRPPYSSTSRSEYVWPAGIGS